VTELRVVFSLNRHPSGRRTVHLADPECERALCGVRAGDEADGWPTSCGACQNIAQRNGRANWPQRVRIDIGPVTARVRAAYSQTFLAIVRCVDLASWNPRRKWWTVPADLAAALADELRHAGFSVVVTETGPSWADVLLDGMCTSCAKDSVAALKTVLMPDSTLRAQLEAALAAYLHPEVPCDRECSACGVASPAGLARSPDQLLQPAWQSGQPATSISG